MMPKIVARTWMCGGFCVALGWVASLGAAELKTESKLRAELESPLVLSSTGETLRNVLTNVSRQRFVAIWLDRRIDPGQLVEYSSRDLPLQSALEKMSEKFHAGVSVVGPVVYVAPIRSAAKLATLAAVKRAEVRRLPAAQSRRLLAVAPWKWPERSEPRELVQKLLDEAGLVAKNLDESIPHDLWPAVEMPPAIWADRLTLVLAGFGLTFRLSSEGQAIIFEPWPDEIAYEYSYAVKGDSANQLAQLKSKFPAAQIRSTSGKIIVQGRFEDHEQIDRLLRGDKVARTVTSGDGDKKFTLNVERQPVGPAAKLIAERLGMQVEFAPEIQNQLNELVTFKVENSSLQEVWQALARAAGLRADVRADKVTLLPGEAKP